VKKNKGEVIMIKVELNEITGEYEYEIVCDSCDTFGYELGLGDYDNLDELLLDAQETGWYVSENEESHLCPECDS